MSIPLPCGCAIVCTRERDGTLRSTYLLKIRRCLLTTSDHEPAARAAMEAAHVEER